MERLHHDAVGRLGEVGDLARFGGVGREGLFAEDMLAGGERGAGPAAVEAVRQRVVDGAEVRVADEIVVARVHLRDAVPGRKRLCPGGVACRDGRDDDFAVLLGGVDQGGRCDAGRAQDADPQLGSHEREVSTPPTRQNFNNQLTSSTASCKVPAS